MDNLFSAEQGVKELEDNPPLSFTGNGEPLIDWRIDGASGGVGDITANIAPEIRVANGWVIGYRNGSNGDYVAANNTGEWLSPKIPMSAGTTFTVSAMPINASSMSMYFWNEDVYIGGHSSNDYSGATFTAPTGTTQIDFAIRAGADKKTEEAVISSGFWVMVNSGSTAETYEPYGKYKIPVICGGETNMIYLNASLGASDSISMTDTGISIPTISGSNTLSVGTTVQPSSVYIKYIEGGDEMVTLAKIGGRYNTALLEIRGLSTDTKPTTKIEGMIITNGSTYIEIDTGDTYMFDAGNGIWHNITG